MTSDVDARGYFVLDKHAVVTFEFEKVQEVDLPGFGPQNVISDLELERVNGVFLLYLDPCYGPAGSIVAEEVSVSIKPGKPGL